MEAYLKRKNDGILDKSVKKMKKEICPHSERCYRKNPHHFKEYEHPHLIKFIEMGDSLVLPDNLPQPKSVYLEQIEVLKPIIQCKGLTRNINEQNIAVDPSKKKSLPNLSGDAGPSSSKRVSSKGKATYKSEPSQINQINKDKCKPGTMLEKLEKVAPYNLFFTTVKIAPETLNEPNAITFTDLLCPSLGDLKCSLQINFMIDIMWLLEQYQKRNLKEKPLTIVYGDDWPDMDIFIERYCPQVTHKLIKMKDPFGCHHTKIGIYVYEDNSLRVVVSTANLYREDWEWYNQGLWLSPACPRLPDSAHDVEGESPTSFKANFLSYLRTYNLPCLKSFIDYVKRADFSAVRTFFVYSAPGKHYPKSVGSHLHRVADLLAQFCTLPQKTTPDSEGPLSWGIIAQASSLGSMGKKPAEWLRGALLRSLASHTKGPRPMNSNATLSIVYPSVENVAHSYLGLNGGGCLPYSKATNEKQRWLQEYMHQWSSAAYGRTRAMPHIKSYCRVSPCLTKLAYFLLTSANISKSAWGGPVAKDMGVYVRSYEAGVLFLPKFFDEEYLEIERTVSSKNKTLFPFMYDLPLVPYRADDYPWCN